MRAVVISEIDSAFKKLVWVKEAQGGIYIGFYGKADEMHYSYHKNGDVHIKHGRIYHPLYKGTPICEINKFSLITGYGITLEKGYEFATSEYIKSKDVDTVIYINPDIIKRQKILNIDSYIVRKGAEADSICDFQKSKGQSFEILNASFFNLDKFHGFMVGIILFGGR